MFAASIYCITKNVVLLQHVELAHISIFLFLFLLSFSFHLLFFFVFIYVAGALKNVLSEQNKNNCFRKSLPVSSLEIKRGSTCFGNF